MHVFDESMPHEAKALLEKHQQILTNAFLGEPLYWRFDESDCNSNRSNERKLYAFRKDSHGPCIATIPLQDLTEITDEDDLQMRIITGYYQPE